MEYYCYFKYLYFIIKNEKKGIYEEMKKYLKLNKYESWVGYTLVKWGKSYKINEKKYDKYENQNYNK